MSEFASNLVGEKVWCRKDRVPPGYQDVEGLTKGVCHVRAVGLAPVFFAPGSNHPPRNVAWAILEDANGNFHDSVLVSWLTTTQPPGAEGFPPGVEGFVRGR